MISRRRPRSVLESSPRDPVTIAKFPHRPAFIRQVSRREHRPGNLLDQFRRSLCSRKRRTSRDIPRANQHIRFRLFLRACFISLPARRRHMLFQPPPQPASPTVSPATPNATSKIQTARGPLSLILYFLSRSTMYVFLERSLIERASVTQGTDAPAVGYQKPARTWSANTACSR